MRLAREGIRQRSDFVGAHRVLTAAAAMAGQIEVATSALQALRRAQPNGSCGWIADHMPIKTDDEREHYLKAFRRAGLIRPICEFAVRSQNQACLKQISSARQGAATAFAALST